MFETHAEVTNTDSSADACLLEDELLEFQAGRCSEAQLARFDAHLDRCMDCRDLVHHWVGSSADDDDEPASGEAWLTTFTPGSVVASRYLIRRFLGKGGMGEVYEAFDRLMRRRVALKTVICTASDRPHAVRKLMDEVTNALRVGHPNVCRINELQEHHDPLNPSAAVPFFTMEFVEGERLGQRSKRGPMPVAEALCVAHQLLDGLQAAHARGVLHLDLKSDNVMLRRCKSPPEVVIMDFGLSRALDRPSRQPSRPRFELAGTLPYMSVEQLESSPTLGPATDVYAFGVVLYEMLTGRLPFTASHTGALLLEQLQTRPPPPSHVVPGLSPALDRFVLRCLASQASQRFAHAGAALEALEEVGNRERRKARGLRRWLGATVASGALAAVVAYEVDRHEAAASTVLPSHELPSTVLPSNAKGEVRAAPPPAAPSIASAPASTEPPHPVSPPSTRRAALRAGSPAKPPVSSPKRPDRRATIARSDETRAPSVDSLQRDASPIARAVPRVEPARDRAALAAIGPAGLDPVEGGGAQRRDRVATARPDWVPQALPGSLLIPRRAR